MPDLIPILFPAPTIRRDPIAVVRWWESHGLQYNAVVGVAGLVTLAIFPVIAPGVHLRDMPAFLMGAAIYGVLANLCYSLGAAGELAIERWLKRPVYGLGPALFRHGLVFSVGLTLVPIGIATIARVMQTISHLFH